MLCDARLLSRLVDRAVIVVKAGSTTRDSTAACEERLKKDGSKVLGVVVNSWNPKESDPGNYMYRDYYQYRDYYRKSESG